jgi:hypothetical protein
MVLAALLAALSFSSASQAASGRVSVHGPKHQTLSALMGKTVSDGTMVTVTGRGYDTKIGIYVTYCVIPKKGYRPEACGPFDITGKNNASVWISSNPPIYAQLLVKPFGKGGTFKEKIKITRMIGNSDCKVVKCAIYTRADHLRSDYRKADVAIPVTIR